MNPHNKSRQKSCVSFAATKTKFNIHWASYSRCQSRKSLCVYKHCAPTSAHNNSPGNHIEPGNLPNYPPGTSQITVIPSQFERSHTDQECLITTELNGLDTSESSTPSLIPSLSNTLPAHDDLRSISFQVIEAHFDEGVNDRTHIEAERPRLSPGAWQQGIMPVDKLQWTS